MARLYKFSSIMRPMEEIEVFASLMQVRWSL